MKYNFYYLAALFLITIGCQPRSSEPALSNTILVQNYYWANEGMEEQVYQQRLLASSVRAKYGLPVGRVLKLQTLSDSLPNIIWECEYLDLEDREKDLQKFQENEELAIAFRKVSSKMGTLTRKFDRAIYEIAPSDN